MKLIALSVFISSLAAVAATEEQLNKRFTVEPGGKLIVDVDFGSIDVTTNATSDMTVDVWRKIARRSKADEEKFLQDHPVIFTQEGNTVTIRCRRKDASGWSWNRGSRNEAKYAIAAPARFNAQLKTAGGGITVSDLAGDVKADTSGGGLRFARLRGPINGETSGGGIQVSDCEGDIAITTSGGGIYVNGGAGSLDGNTSGGPVSVKAFKGNARVETSGGGITIENVTGRVEGSTSGGSVSAVLSSPLEGDVRLSTSGGGVTVVVSEHAAFSLDAATSAGRVTSDLPVTVIGKVERDRLKGTVNGGGKSVVLRSSAGSIRLKKL